MDFGAVDELDYEEDGPDLLKNNSESVNCLENGVSRDVNFPSCEGDYLQINCSEEDENFLSGEQFSENDVALEKTNNFVSGEPHSETSKPEIGAEETVGTEKSQKTIEENGKAKQKIFIKEELCTQRNANNFNNRVNNRNGNANKKKTTKRKSAWFYRRRCAVKKKLISSLSFHPWLPEYGFSEGGDAMNHSNVAPNDNRFLRPSAAFEGGFQLRQNWQKGQLVADNERLVSSKGIGVNDIGLSQQRFAPLMSGSVTPSNEDISEFKTDDRNVNLFKNSMCDDSMNDGVSLNNEKFSCSNFVQENINVVWKQSRENFAHNCRVGEPKGGNENALEGLNARNPNCIPPSKNGWEYGQEKCPVKINAFKEEEKELVKLKKEARRKRFMQDDIIGKEKELLESCVVKGPDSSLPKDFFKMKEPKLFEKMFHGREDEDHKSDEGFLLGKGKLKKELLLKKRNPFDGRTEMTTCVAGTKIKQEVICRENLETEHWENSLGLKEAKEEKQAVEGEESKVLSSFYSKGPGLFIVKNETGSRVKFVRTISKSLHELGFGKSKMELISQGNESKPLALKPLPFPSEDMQEQVMPQLTGRVVKVLNIPPSTTTNDILSLCSGIGIVREVKLNFPKENSAVIRFAEASSAENFFSLYHGQKMNNYFLNVIII